MPSLHIHNIRKTILQSLIYNKTKQLTEEKEMFAEAEKYADAGFRFLIEGPFSSVAIKLESGSIPCILVERKSWRS